MKRVRNPFFFFRVTRSSRAESRPREKGFALVITVSLMTLLALLAVGLLSLSTVSLRSSSQSAAMAEARANARLALQIALGELQREMGPDMRISAESAIFDQNHESEEIDGVEQARWLATYDSWGTWLNASYNRPDGGGSLDIGDTYTPRREAMFRRWLLSLPPGKEDDVDAPSSISGWDESNSVLMVGEGSLGGSGTGGVEEPTRAYLVDVGDTGRQAWWIGPENHKAKVTLARQPRDLGADEWEVAHGSTAEMGVGALAGFGTLDDSQELSEKLVSHLTLGNAEIDPELVGRHFFDLTANSKGVLSSVRTGHLKKDLSLLFEGGASDLTPPYSFGGGRAIREPSIRPMSPDLTQYSPKIPNRHFQSWTNMRHFYRMYRQESDATVGGTRGKGSLNWERGTPFTDHVASTSLGRWGSEWDGSNNYWRIPILAKITFIYSLVTEPNRNEPGKFDCYHVYSPVFTFWNPYNVEMRFPSGNIEFLTSAYKVWPNSGTFWEGNTLKRTADQLGAFGQFGYSQGVVTRAHVRNPGNRGDVVFKPGELKVFSLDARIENGSQASNASLVPGFNPQGVGGEKKLYGTYSPRDNPGITVEFSHNYWGGNINYGNTCGSLCMVSWWERDRNPGAVPVNYAIDWLQKGQRTTPITPPGAGNIARWVFTDRDPVPVAFTQLVIKGLSEFDYESIRWDQDWRSRNWIQAPPFYFGSGMYISENDTIAHTQRLDSPYVVFFGPTSMAELPKVVAQIGDNSLLGSGSNPFEKVTAVPALELPTAPVGSLAAFSAMRINPGWVAADQLGSHLSVDTYGGNAVQSFGAGESLYAAETKRVAYQSGVTGPGIGNSFMHPMLPRTEVYQYSNNSVSQDILDRSQPDRTTENDTMAYSDYWDHVFLLNDALWDDYFVSSLADQARPGASSGESLASNIERLIDGDFPANPRYLYYGDGSTEERVKSELEDEEGYLKAAGRLMVDGMFNVNSTSVDAWYALFSGIRERQLVYRDRNGRLQPVSVPSGKRIAVSRFNTPTTDQEMVDPEYGVNRGDGQQAWSGVRFLDDEQLRRLAEECVKQVKQRGPFLNFSEFVNRRLSDDELGLMGALQSAIDYDDDSPDSSSINYAFKNGPDFMIDQSNLGRTEFATPEAAEGSRFAGIPGYVIQSDILKPIANNLSVRDDTFRVRAYGEALDAGGEVIARAWCEAIVQRTPEYYDPTNDPEEPARTISTDGRFVDNPGLAETNRRFGRKMIIESFRWLSADEI